MTRKKAVEDYKTGKITISKAAEKANLTIWEMEKYLIKQGFKSQYSTQDLLEKMRKLKDVRR
ncbi:MAG: UPF0175 family protein [archaeon]